MGNVVGLIGIHGLKGSGKDTVAEMIYHEVLGVEGSLSCITHYADTLKRAAASLFDVDIKWFYDEKLKEQTIPGLNLTPRQIMTDFHDVLIPKFGPDLFVRTVRAGYAKWLEGDSARGPYVIADVRYDPRETSWIRESGGIVLHVLRKSVVKGVAASRHSSEYGIPLSAGDFVIHNDGSLADLKDCVVSVLRAVRGHP